MTGAIDFASLKASIRMSAVVGASIKINRSAAEFVACCPFYEDASPSFTVNDAKGFAHCFGCGWHGDAADFVAAIDGCSLREAAERLGAGDFASKRPSNVIAVDFAKPDTIEAARRIWRQAKPIGGTAAEAYLRRRGIHQALPPTLRFSRLKHPEGGLHPCLVAVATAADQTFAGIQRTFLTDDGQKADVDPVKMSLGRIRGCAIRLAPPAGELVLCEGVEDALTLQQELGQAAWATAGAGGLSAVELPSGVRSVIIGADVDETGLREARKAARRFAAEGRRARVIRPVPGFKDFNAELQGVRS